MPRPTRSEFVSHQKTSALLHLPEGVKRPHVGLPYFSGVGIGVVHAGYERRLAHHLGAHSTPSILGIINGKISFFHNAVVRENLRQFVESLLPGNLVEKVSTWLCSNWRGAWDCWLPWSLWPSQTGFRFEQARHILITETKTFQWSLLETEIAAEVERDGENFSLPVTTVNEGLQS